MRRVVSLVAFVCMLFIFCSVSFAHSGEVDSFGGHSSAYGYHYHHGHPAHEHAGGVCPYGDYLGRRGFYGGYYSFWDGWDGWPYVFVFGILFAVSGLWLAVGAIKDKYYELRYKRRVTRIVSSTGNASSIREGIGNRSCAPANSSASFSGAPYTSDHGSIFADTRPAFGDVFTLSQSSQAVDVLRKALSLFQTKEDIVHLSLSATSVFDIKVVKALLGMYQRNSMVTLNDNNTACAIIALRETELTSNPSSVFPMLSMEAAAKALSRMPPDTIIGADMLPREEAAKRDWGDKYTVYITQYDKHHHSRYCAMGRTPVHVCNVRFSPCPDCQPERPDLSWYYQFVWICDMRKKYGLDKSNTLILSHGREVRRPNEKTLGPGGE